MRSRAWAWRGPPGRPQFVATGVKRRRAIAQRLRPARLRHPPRDHFGSAYCSPTRGYRATRARARSPGRSSGDIVALDSRAEARPLTYGPAPWCFRRVCSQSSSAGVKPGSPTLFGSDAVLRVVWRGLPYGRRLRSGWGISTRTLTGGLAPRLTLGLVALLKSLVMWQLVPGVGRLLAANTAFEADDCGWRGRQDRAGKIVALGFAVRRASRSKAFEPVGARQGRHTAEESGGPGTAWARQ